MRLRLVLILALAGIPATALSAARPASAQEAWLEGAVIYGVVPPLFGGEPLQDVTRRLDYLQQLGVDAIWLAPLNPTDDPGAISYSITDYFSVRTDFGSEAELRQLVAQAHLRGMKVLMDFVPNHVSAQHPYFLDAQARGKRSPYYRYFARDAAGQPTHYFDWEHLKNLNYENPRVARMMIDAFAYWVREFGIDGFRVDAAWGIRQRSPAFWARLDRELSALNPEVFLLAEASARDPYYLKNGFDAAYDWTNRLGQWAWEDLFAKPSRIGPRLNAALSKGGTPPHRIARFLNNNDTGPRFITRYGLPTTRVAAVLLHTLPGIPIVYSGDEVGAEYEPYGDPPPLRWEDPHQLAPLYRKLAALRESLPALRQGRFTEVPILRHPQGYAFLRSAGEAEQVLVVLNFGRKATFPLALPAPVRQRLEAGAALRDELTGREVKLELTDQGRLLLPLEATSALVLSVQ